MTTTRHPSAPLAAFYLATAAFAWWRFSDNTADNDLWGHVLYGQRMLALGALEKTDPFSWTAPAAPWINHEVLAEIAMGWTHRVAGGTGLWVLAIGFALATVVVALWIGRASRERGLGAVQAALLAASTNGIALGFSVRPQLFTMFAFVVLLALMRALYAGNRWPFAALPALFFLWVNTHGGVLAGLAVLAAAAVATAMESFIVSHQADSGAENARANISRPPPRAWLAFTGAVSLGAIASLVTPWGPESLRWLIKSVSYLRPEITEWRATPLDFAHGAFWAVTAVSIAAWIATRRERRAWEATTLALLLVMACRHQRHIPLFLLANLALTPSHLLDLVARLVPRAENLRRWALQPAARLIATIALVGAAGAATARSVGPPKHNPCKIEIERDQYPCAALQFLADHPIDGNLLVFFDWGQQAMWELPNNRVSFDGRLDTVYPRSVIEAHWKLNRGEIPDPAVLDLNAADVALVPSASPVPALLRSLGWYPLYADPLASILVRKAPARRGTTIATAAAVAGREPFPDTPSARASPRRLPFVDGRH